MKNSTGENTSMKRFNKIFIFIILLSCFCFGNKVFARTVTSCGTTWVTSSSSRGGCGSCSIDYSSPTGYCSNNSSGYPFALCSSNKAGYTYKLYNFKCLEAVTEEHYTLTINPNGGSFNDETTAAKTASPDLIVGQGNWWNISDYAVSRTGYTFEGWYDSATGGTKVYNADGTCVNGTSYWTNNGYKNAGDLTVYAHWKSKTYKVTVHPNGGTISSGDTAITTNSDGTLSFEATYDATYYYSLGVDAVRSGYTMKGIYDATSGGAKLWDDTNKNKICLGDGTYWNSNHEWIFDNDSQTLDLYVQWESDAIRYTVDCLADSSGNLITDINSKIANNGEYQIITKTFEVPKTETRTFCIGKLIKKESAISYIGYYADVDDDGTVDGVIFADLAFNESGTWGNNNNGTWSYTAQTGLKDYYVSQESYTGKFGTAAVISPVSGTTGNDRFYVMALSDISTDRYDFHQGLAQKNSLDTIVSAVGETDNDFGSGKSNSEKLETYYENNDDKDLHYTDAGHKDTWGQIKEGWFVASKSEWSAFANNLNITSSNYSLLGLSDWYWAASVYNYLHPYMIYFKGDALYGNNVLQHCSYNVRLATTY